MKQLYLLSTLLLLAVFLPQNVKAQVSVWDGTYAPWTHGSGTEADPFLIENAQQLAYLAVRVNNGLDAAGGHVSNHDLHYKLMTDVNLNGSETFQWTPIGYCISETNYQSFGGHFDGNNHTVLGLYINNSANSVGFFGYTDGATITNLSVSGDTVASTTTTINYAGGIVGYASETNFTNCVNNNITIFASSSPTYFHSSSFSGGIVGVINGASIIKNCYNTGNVFTFTSSEENYLYTYSGGIVGQINGTAAITNCYNTGNAYSSSTSSSGKYFYSYSGGIVGQNSGFTTIINSYNIGNISSTAFINNTTNSYSYSSGIVGYNSSSISIINSYNTGGISSMSDHPFSGGILGTSNYNHTVANCFYLDTCNCNNTYGGSPMAATIMLTPEFVGLLNNGSCAWEQDTPPYVNDGYPILTMILEEANTEPATDLTATSAKLHGSISVENATITSKGFEYRALGDPVYISVNVTNNDNAFSYTLNGLTPNTTYEYRTFVNVAECSYTAYGATDTFEVSWMNADTILIYDADMLLWVSQRCNSGVTFEGKYIKLMNNIVLPANQPNNMTSIGIYPNYPFKGTFDGNGMTITNLYIDQPNTPYQGFFGYTQNANLYQVGLVNITASGRNYTGGMVAYAENTYMRECYVNGGSLFALSYCGGLVGFQQMGTNSIISGCYSTCTVSGNNYVGGLVGYSNYSTVRNSYVAASVSGQGAAIGAIIGGANEVLMYNCYFSSAITGQSSAIGENNLRTNEGMTDEAMRAPSFVNILNQGLVVPVWKADYAVPINNGFPILIWQYSDVVACEAPVNPVGILSGDSATLSWTGGDNADHFIVEYGISGSPAITQNTPNHQLVLHNLQNGSYYWRVKTVCAFGESNFVNGTPIAVIPDSHDTIIINVHDTTYIDVPYPVHDTTFVDVYVPVHDTTYVDVPYYLHDTTFVNVHDTTFINVPYAVHDTTYITIYDTTAGLVFHDTLYVDVPYPVYDTTYIDVYVTIHDTTYVDVPYPVHDTTYVDVPYLVHDTTYITLSDTILITLYDTTYLTVHDTVTVTEQLTWHSLQVYSESINKGVAAGSGQFPEGTNVEIAAIPIEGYRFLQWDDGYTWNPRTITLNENLTLTAMFTTVGVTDLELPTWYVYPEQGAFVVKGTGGHQVSVYDAVGKLLHRYSEAPEILRYSVPAAGSYYIQVDNGAAKKVTVVR